MFKNRSSFFLWLGSLGIACIAMQGCFVIGYTIGSSTDGSSADSALFSNISRHYGDQVRVLVNDSTVPNATFLRFETESDTSYVPRFRAFSATHPGADATLQLGDSITSLYKDNRMRSFRFDGYPPVLSPLLDTVYDRSAESRTDAEGRRTKLSGREIDNLLALNAVPVRARLQFRDKGSDFELTNSDFKNVWSISAHNSGKAIGTIVGVAIDLAILVLLPHLLLKHL